MSRPLAGSLVVPTLGPRAARLTGSLLSLAVCAAGVVAVAGPAMRVADESPTSGRVTVQVLGQISTAGLPSRPAVSVLTVHNAGASPLRWSARPQVDGPGAAGVVVETWVPASPGCTTPTTLLGADAWSATSLEPGASTALCVRISTTGTVSGQATPHVTVAARAV